MDLEEIKTRLHSAIDLMTDDVLKEADCFPLIVQQIAGNEGGSNANSQSITMALYFDFRTINNGDNCNNFQNGNDSASLQKLCDEKEHRITELERLNRILIEKGTKEAEFEAFNLPPINSTIANDKA